MIKAGRKLRCSVFILASALACSTPTVYACGVTDLRSAAAKGTVAGAVAFLVLSPSGPPTGFLAPSIGAVGFGVVVGAAALVNACTIPELQQQISDFGK
jgi:hypothetical protein